MCSILLFLGTILEGGLKEKSKKVYTINWSVNFEDFIPDVQQRVENLLGFE
jgi:hypothetical protein